MTAARTAAAMHSAAAKKAWDTIRANRKNPPKPKPKPKMEPQKPVKLPKKVEPSTISEMMARTVVLVLTFSGIGNRRKVDTSKITVDADKEWIGVTKKLFDAEELEQILSLDGEARRYVESRALPSMIKKGVYLLPVDFVEEVDERLKQYVQNRKPQVESMIRRLDELTANAKARLKHLFDASQYPTPDELRAAFKLTWRFVFVDSAKNLEMVSKELYEEERKKAEADWAETRDTIQQLLRTHLSEMVDHMVDKMTPDTDGKPKIFRESSIEKMNDFLQTFDARNITNDAQMHVLVEKARSLMRGIDAESLRTHEDVREYVAYGFQTIKTLLDPMIISKPHRAIRLKDE